MNPRNILLAVLAPIVLIAGIYALLRPNGKDDRIPPLPPHVVEKINEAQNATSSNDWCSAKEKWQAVVDSLKDLQSTDQHQRSEQLEAETNLQTATERCSGQTVETLEVAPRPIDPPPVPKQELRDRYPYGRTVRGLAILNVSGHGRNKYWSVFREEAHFAWQYRVLAETRVVANRGLAVVFEQSLPEVTQTLVTSSRELRLEPPDSPVLRLAWGQLEKNLLQKHPVYAGLRAAADVANTMDPGLVRTLTAMTNRMEQMGLVHPAGITERAARIENLQGVRVEMEYVSGLGVTSIRVIEGPVYDEEVLRLLAYNSGLLMDYFVLPSTKKAVGETWTVSAADVAGMINFGYSAEVAGKLTLKRDANRENRAGESEAVLRVVSGGVALERNRSEGRQQAQLQCESGVIYYALDDFVVREARASWKVSSLWNSRHHLLFGTERVKNLKVESYYEAERVLPEAVP